MWFGQTREVGGDFRHVPKFVVGALGFAVLWLRYREGGSIAIGAHVGCNVVDLVYQLCRYWFVLSCHQAGENFQLSYRPLCVE